MGEDNEFNCIKIVVVGDSGCGKSCLIQRFISDTFPEIYIPTGFDKYTVGFEVGGHRFSAAIWDTSGASAYDMVRPLAYQDTHVFLICFHLGDTNSLENAIKKWYPEVKQNSSLTPVILCGCQSDQRFVNEDYDMSMYSISTSTSDSVTKFTKRQTVYSEKALAASRQIGAVTYVEASSLFNNRTAQEAFEVCALAAKGKLNNNKISSSTKSSSSSDASSSSSTTTLSKHRTLFKLRKSKSNKFQFENNKFNIDDEKDDLKKCRIM